MFSSSKKPYTAVTVQVERLTGPSYEENDLSGVVDLIEVVRIQDSGPTEAARALRKKLKYGSPHRQLRALTLLDGLIQNGGGRFQRAFADEALLERLRMLPRDDMVDSEVQKKCNTLYRQWATAYAATPGLQGIATLHKQLPKRAKPQASQSKVVRETEAQAAENPFGSEEDDAPSSSTPTSSSPTSRRKMSEPPSPATPTSSAAVRARAGSLSITPTNSSSKKDSSKKGKDKKNRYKAFSLEKEKPKILESIATSNVASTNLLNSLRHFNRENQQVSQDPEILKRFETCKVLRRQILRYIQVIESDQWLGSLLNANDELVKALMAFEVMDKSIEDDSDSENEGLMHEPGLAEHPSFPRRDSKAKMEQSLAGLSIQPKEEIAPAKPPRPPVAPSSQQQEDSLSDFDEDDDEDDEDNPFGDHNALKT